MRFYPYLILALLVVLTVSIERGSFAETQKHGKEASTLTTQKTQAYLAFVKWMDRQEKKHPPKLSASLEFHNVLVAQAYAEAIAKGCLVAGWIGDASRGGCKPANNSGFYEAREVCQLSGEKIPCNPKIFGPSSCASPADNRWTNACVHGLYTNSGISNKSLDDTLTSEDLDHLKNFLNTLFATNSQESKNLVTEVKNLCQSIETPERTQDIEDCNRLSIEIQRVFGVYSDDRDATSASNSSLNPDCISCNVDKQNDAKELVPGFMTDFTEDYGENDNAQDDNGKPTTETHPNVWLGAALAAKAGAPLHNKVTPTEEDYRSTLTRWFNTSNIDLSIFTDSRNIHTVDKKFYVGSNCIVSLKNEPEKFYKNAVYDFRVENVQTGKFYKVSHNGYTGRCVNISKKEKIRDCYVKLLSKEMVGLCK